MCHIFAMNSVASPANTLPWLLPCDGARFVVLFSFADARGVGQEEEPLAPVRGAEVGC